MLMNCDPESGSGTNRQTMSDDIQEDVSMQLDSSEEITAHNDPAPVTANPERYYYESLPENMFNLSMESDLDDDDGDFSPYASSRGPPLPFVFDNYSYLDDEDDGEEMGIDYKLSKIEGLDHVPMNSPRWYALVRPHLTALEREELWDSTPWAVKFYWCDTDDTDAEDEDRVDSPLYKEDEYNIELN